MRGNKKMIWFYAILLSISLVITYLIELNSEMKFIIVNSPYISSSFCFAIFSGILTGLIVALAAEIRQYWVNKTIALDSLFSYLLELYALITVQQARIMYYINHPNESIVEGYAKKDTQTELLAPLKAIERIDYVSFLKRDKVYIALNFFKTKSFEIENAVNDLVNIDIAYNEVKIKQLENDGKTGKVMAIEPLILTALKKENAKLDSCIKHIEQICIAFFDMDDKKYNWKAKKEIAEVIKKQITNNLTYIPK